MRNLRFLRAHDHANGIGAPGGTSTSLIAGFATGRYRQLDPVCGDHTPTPPLATGRPPCLRRVDGLTVGHHVPSYVASQDLYPSNDHIERRGNCCMQNSKIVRGRHFLLIFLNATVEPRRKNLELGVSNRNCLDHARRAGIPTSPSILTIPFERKARSAFDLGELDRRPRSQPAHYGQLAVSSGARDGDASLRRLLRRRAIRRWFGSTVCLTSTES
jgi:hypothetical protein